MSPVPFQVANVVGNLVEARVFALADREATDAYGLEVAATAMKVGPGAVLCADHRPVRIYPDAAAERLIELFRPNNKRFTRITLIINPTNATLLLQLERLVRAAGSDMRRVFREPQGALEHLAGALGPEERARAKAFLAEGADDGARPRA